MSAIVGRSMKTWEHCVSDDMKLLGLHSEWAIFMDMWMDLIWGKRLTLASRGKRDEFKINDDDDDDDDDDDEWIERTDRNFMKPEITRLYCYLRLHWRIEHHIQNRVH